MKKLRIEEEKTMMLALIQTVIFIFFTTSNADPAIKIVLFFTSLCVTAYIAYKSWEKALLMVVVMIIVLYIMIWVVLGLYGLLGGYSSEIGQQLGKLLTYIVFFVSSMISIVIADNPEILEDLD
jgi:fatty-acid desaturase